MADLETISAQVAALDDELVLLRAEREKAVETLTETIIAKQAERDALRIQEMQLIEEQADPSLSQQIGEGK